MGQLIKELGPPLHYSQGGGGPMSMEIFESSQNSFKACLMGNSIIILSVGVGSCVLCKVQIDMFEVP
jgi:hypothetical protein